MTAPTEQEIRAILEPSKQAMTDYLGEAIHEATGLVSYTSPLLRNLADSGGVWDNLRPSEEGRLELHIEQAYTDLYDSLAQAIVDRVAEAALRFAGEYPNAPRVTRESVLKDLEDESGKAINRALDRLEDVRRRTPPSDPSPIQP